MRSDAPNIILNLQSNNSNRKELKVYAIIGIFLQLCVLVFFGIITYHPSVKNSFQKDDQRADDYAFPLAISGTLVLALGVFLCGTVVESSTRETHYKKNDEYEMRIVWIQQKQTVGDQVFDPFATFPDTPRDVVTMSRRCDKAEARPLEPLTIIGICTGLAGFIIQFIGLRGMNSAATLAQLGIVGAMTVIRAWVRRGLAMPPRQEKLTSDFELDTLAWALALLADSRNQSPGAATSLVSPERGAPGGAYHPAEQSPLNGLQLGDVGPFMNMERQKGCSWTISTGSDVHHKPFLQHRSPCYSTAQQVLDTRRNLSRLAQFKGPSASEAVSLVTAMEKVLDALFPMEFEDDQREWTWPLAIVYSDPGSASSSQCHVHLSLIGKDGQWKVLADQLESVLSLCLFTAHEQEENESKRGQPKFDLNDQNDDWLRQKTMRSDLGIRLLGSTNKERTNQLIQDLRWWTPESFDILAEIQEVEGLREDDSTDRPVNGQRTEPMSSLEGEIRGELSRILKRNPKFDSAHVDDKRVVGYGPPRPRPQSGSGGQRHFCNYSALTMDQRRYNRRGVLAIESRDSLEKLYAKDLLFSFLLSAAKTLPEPLQGEIETRDAKVGDFVNRTSKALFTHELTSLAAEFVHLGYGTEQEVWTNTIAALSVAEKLPFPWPMLNMGKEKAEEFRLKGEWLSAGGEHLYLWTQTQCYLSSSQCISTWGTALMMEYYDEVLDQVKLLTAEEGRELLGAEEGSELLGAQVAISDLSETLELARHQTGLLDHLLRVYEKQRRPALVELLQELGGCAQHGNFPDSLGITGFHLYAMGLTEEYPRPSTYEETRNAANEKDICQWTPLHYASVQANHPRVKELLLNAADPDVLDWSGLTPLHYGCQFGGIPLVMELLAWGGKLDARGLRGATPLHFAAKHGNVDLFRPHTSGFDEQKESLCKLKDDRGRIPVHWAVMHGHESVVRQLKSNIDEPDVNGWTSLHLATLYHKTGLYYDASTNMIDVVFELSEDREKKDGNGRTALVLAIETLKTEAAHQLIELGADVHAMTSQGGTTIQSAVFEYGDASLVQALVNKGVRVDIPWEGRSGWTPLHAAAREGRDDMMKIILEALDSLGPEACSSVIELGDENSQTALHLAAVHKHLSVVKLLLAAGADPNRGDGLENTAFHKVFDSCKDKQAVCLELVKTLAEHNANPHARNNHDETPFDMAKREGHMEAAEYIKKIEECE